MKVVVFVPAKGSSDRIQNKNFDEAVRVSDALLCAGDKAEYYWQRSHLMHLQNNTEAAILFSREAVLRDSSSTRFLLQLGTLLISSGDLDGAEEQILAAYALNPMDAVTQQRLSALRLRQKRYDEALAAAERAVILAPSDEQLRSHRDRVLALQNAGGH